MFSLIFPYIPRGSVGEVGDTAPFFRFPISPITLRYYVTLFTKRFNYSEIKSKAQINEIFHKFPPVNYPVTIEYRTLTTDY